MQKTCVRSLGWEDFLEKEMATHSSIPAWEIQCTEETGGLQSMESHTIWQLKNNTLMYTFRCVCVCVYIYIKYFNKLF